jgi:AsmA protein
MAARRKWPYVLGAVVAVLVVAVAVGLFVLDGVLTGKAKEQAATLSKQLGRPVGIGSVSTKLLTGLGVRVGDVKVGAAAGEKLPMLSLKRVEVKVALLRALFSKGKQIEVKSAEVEGLTVNVIKLDDGKTNLEHLQEKLAEESAKKPKKPEPKQDEKASDLSGVTIDHLALLDGTVRFLDETGKEDRQLEINKLSVVVNDLKAGKPLDVVVKAAVLATKENFELRLHAAPLPPTLVPTPERVVLKIEPIDLAPIAPFVPSTVGLQAGHLDADFDALLGAAVPGGSGNTKVKGVVNAKGLKFAGAEGGKALDVTLDTDLDGDAEKGDLDIRKLKLEIGPAGISGTGRARGLKTPSPRVEGLQITSHDLDPARLAALYPPLKKQLKGQIAGPIGLTVRGSGSAAKQNVEVMLDFTPVRLAVPQSLTKAAGAKMTLVAHVKGSGGGDQLAFDMKADLSGVDLRPGESLDKKPGDALDVSLEGTKSGGSKKGQAMKVALSSLTAHVLDATFTGKADVEMAGEPPDKTTTFSASLQSPKVDVDKLLMESKQKKEKPPPDPKTYAGLQGKADVKIDEVILKKQHLTNVVAQITLEEDKLTVKTAQLTAFKGRVAADGTTLRLAHPDEPMHVKVSLKDIDIEEGLKLVGDKKVLGGKFNGDIALDAKGQDPDLLKKTLAGIIQGNLADGAFYGKDLVAGITGPLASKLPFGLAGKAGHGGATPLGKQLPFGLQIQNGRANLKEALKVPVPDAPMTLSGGLTLEGMLDMAGRAELSPQLIASITGGKAKVSSPVPVAFKLGGPAWKPEFTALDLGPALQVIAKSAGGALVGRFLGGAAGSKAEEVIGGGADKAKQDAENAARERAKGEADKQKKKLEEEAKSRLKGLFGR